MAVSNEELVGLLSAKLTAMLGSNGAGIAEDTLGSAIESALDDLARFRPRVTYEIVDLVPDKPEYPVPAGAFNVLDVVFPAPLGNALGMSWATVGDGDLSSYNSHSLAVILAQKQEQLDNLYGFDWEYDIDENTVRVMPVPQSASKMVLKIAYRRTLSEVPTRFTRQVEDLAMAACLRGLAVSMSGGITSIPIGIGNVSFDSGKLIQQADSLRGTALKALGTTGAGVVIAG